MVQRAHLEITTKIGCKNNCIYCPQSLLLKNYVKKSKETNLSFNKFKKYLNSIPKNVQIHFSGFAEPWLNNVCTKMVRYADEQGYKIKVYTTLIGMELTDVKQLKYVPYLTFEIHLPDKNGNTKIKVDEKYIKILTEISRSNIKNISYMCLGHIDTHLKKIIATYQIVEIIDRPENPKADKKNPRHQVKGEIRCSRYDNLFRGNVLLPNGDVVFCFMDYGMKHVLGNLNIIKYKDLFESNEYKTLVNGTKDDSIDILCRKCNCAKQATLYIKCRQILSRIKKGMFFQYLK